MTDTTKVTVSCPNNCQQPEESYDILASKILELDTDPDRVREWLFHPTEGECAYCRVPLSVEVGDVAFSGP